MHTLGFGASWKQMTREKGWYKPILILALVGWVPILGQIAVLGYAFEWARLTAWGLDAAPKQHGVNVGKVLGTGAWVFLVYVSQVIVTSVVLGLLTAGAVDMVTSPLSLGLKLFPNADGDAFDVGILGAALGLLVGAFIQAAMMRATLYDGFTAGWRLDRLFEMVGRDFGGFMRTYLAMIIASVIVVLVDLVFLIPTGLIVLGGSMGFLYALGTGFHHGYMLSGGIDGIITGLIQQMFSFNPAMLLLTVLLFLVFAFVCRATAVAMQMVAVNVTGQWFSRFGVDRWGVSSDPLPDDVPQGFGTRRAAPTPGPSSPVPPASGAASSAAGPAPQAGAPTSSQAPSDWSPAAYEQAAHDGAAAAAAHNEQSAPEPVVVEPVVAEGEAQPDASTVDGPVVPEDPAEREANS